MPLRVKILLPIDFFENFQIFKLTIIFYPYTSTLIKNVKKHYDSKGQESFINGIYRSYV